MSGLIRMRGMRMSEQSSWEITGPGRLRRGCGTFRLEARVDGEWSLNDANGCYALAYADDLPAAKLRAEEALRELPTRALGELGATP